MIQAAKSIRTFVGSKNFDDSRRFYEALEFRFHPISPGFGYMEISPGKGFYLQDYYVREWCENMMLFLEVEDLESYWSKVTQLNLPIHFPGVKVSQIQKNDWGDEFFIHDPAGVLWHIGIIR